MNHGYLFGTGNSGMYWPASNSDLAFKTDNTERIRIIENGNVGIGTSAPNKKIHVYDEANAEIDIQSVAGAGNHWGIYVNNPQNNLRFWQGDNRITFTDSGELIIADHDTPFATLSIDKGVDPASFEMRGASGKNFKISLNADPYTTFYSAAYYKFIQDGIPAFNLSYFGSSINSELSVNSLDDPFYSLDVDGGANSAIVNINDVTDPVPVWTGLRLERDNSEKWFVGLDNTNDNNLLFRRNAAETIMTIADNGNVAIGAIATPGTKLEVDGNVIAAEPTLGAHLATKNYVDANAGGSDGYIGNIGPHTAGGLLTMNGNNINLAGSFISLDGTDAGLSIGAGNNVLMSSDLRIADDLRWQGELEPDGATCAPGEILKKVSSNNWDCAVDETGAGGGDTDWVEGAGVVYNLNDNIGIGTAIPNYSLDTTGDIFTSTHLLSDAWYGTTGNGGVAQDLWIGDANDTVQIQGSLAVTGNASAADPTQNQHLATKAYVDAQAGGSRAMYYHTGSDEEYDGTNVDTACDVGYHVCIANEWVGAKYDTSKINGGYEPELTDSAWFVASGGSDCSNWSSNNPVYEAATVKFDSNGTAIEQAGWYHNKESCDTVNPVLCCND